MKLTGLQIFKYLPGSKKEANANCKKCGFPTCMAFAMKLAKKEVGIDKCEFITDELKALLEEASQVQQKEIAFGLTNRQVKVGNETVMFRHEKKFVNKTCISIKLQSSDPEFKTKLQEITGYTIDRVGEDLTIDAIALVDIDDSFIAKANEVIGLDFPLILVSSNPDNIKAILADNKGIKPLVCLENNDINKIAEIEKEFSVPVVISGNTIEDLALNSEKTNPENAVLNLRNPASKSLIENMTYIRRAAIEDKFKPLGFPVMIFIDEIQGIGNSIIEKSIWASALLCKYSNIIVLDEFDKALVYSLLTLRQNIYTDPQKPLQIDPNLFSIADVNENAPLFVTTNFALTYFTVVGEVEASNIPAYLLITPSDGMSVLTAWAADKFNGPIIAKAVKEFDVENKIKHRKIIIPGLVANLKEEIEEEMPGWEVIIGPNEAIEIVDFLKEYTKVTV